MCFHRYFLGAINVVKRASKSMVDPTLSSSTCSALWIHLRRTSWRDNLVFALAISLALFRIVWFGIGSVLVFGTINIAYTQMEFVSFAINCKDVIRLDPPQIIFLIYRHC